MSYEVFQQGPEVYVPLLFLALITTVLAYGGFPFIFAKTRKSPITKNKYRGKCYGINIAVSVVFAFINGGSFNLAPYLLWTWIFTSYGTKVLIKRGVMTDETDIPDTSNSAQELTENLAATDKICFCRKCGEKLLDNSRFCRKCGTKTVDVTD